MLALNSIISSSIIDEESDLGNDRMVNHFLNIVRLIDEKIYLPENSPFFSELRLSAEKLPQSVRTQFLSVIARKKVKLSERQDQNLSDLKLDLDALLQVTSNLIDLLVVGEHEGVALGLKPGSQGRQLGAIEVAFGTLVEQSRLVKMTSLHGEYEKNTTRDLIWKNLFSRDVEHSEFISIVDRYFFNPDNFGMRDNASRWFITQIQKTASNCKLISIFCEEKDELRSDRFRKQLGFIVNNIPIEMFLVPGQTWKQSQHQRYIRYGRRGSVIIDPGFDGFSSLIPKTYTYQKSIRPHQTNNRKDWETRVSQSARKVSIGLQ